MRLLLLLMLLRLMTSILRVCVRERMLPRRVTRGGGRVVSAHGEIVSGYTKRTVEGGSG